MFAICVWDREGTDEKSSDCRSRFIGWRLVRRLKAEGLWVRGINIGAEETVIINRVAPIIMEITGKKLSVRHIQGPLPIRGRNSGNPLIRERSNRAPSQPLEPGQRKTRAWIAAPIERLGSCGGVRPALQTAGTGRR